MLPGVELARRRRIRNYSLSRISHSSLPTTNVDDRSSSSTLPHRLRNHYPHHHKYHNHHQHKEQELHLRHSYRAGSNSRQMPTITHEQLQVSPHESRDGSDSISSGRNNVVQRETSRQTRLSIFLQSHSENNLQGPALEARDRLDERLRAAALGNRRHVDASLPRSGERYIHTVHSDEEEETFWDEEEWVMSMRELLAAGGPSSRDSWESEWRIRAGRSGNSNKGMSNLSTLRREVFRQAGEKHSDTSSTTACKQLECSVCLDLFLVGQILFRLPCNHSFHPQCLTPWLEGHTQCPYCRSEISVSQPDSYPSSTSPENSDLQQTDSVSWLSAFETGFHRLNLLSS
ncbi:hypothetical protein O6H91_23G009900 [Diphasiastrum complanatum]|uniref:Uncharacterized protein n=1 Tax=Diphasiastrum complanatum TaxID=34168 RepID=A0ACC2A7Z7_DIPCM|nr:hypothetical protein O6H91_23G009900 [Diphasiastrum complanatum]